MPVVEHPREHAAYKALIQGVSMGATNKRRCLLRNVHGPWLDSFENFLADMGPCPPMGRRLKRVDNTKPYQPGNVEWA